MIRLDEARRILSEIDAIPENAKTAQVRIALASATTLAKVLVHEVEEQQKLADAAVKALRELKVLRNERVTAVDIDVAMAYVDRHQLGD